MQVLWWIKVLEVALVWLNIAATIVLLSASGASLFQRLAQTVVIWLLPFVGAMLVFHLHWEHLGHRRHKETLSAGTSHQYVLQSLEAQARLIDHATHAVLQESTIATVSDSLSNAADGS